MKKIYAVFCFLFIATLSFSQTLPAAFNLASANYSFVRWDSLAAAGTYPTNMVFHYTISSESSSYNHRAEGARDYDCAYNLKSRNRILGYADSGIAFLATSSAQYNDCTSGTADSNRYVGDAVLGINTTGKTGVQVKWTGIVYVTGDGNGDPSVARQATVRLQYRIGTSGLYTDLVNGTDTIECNTTGKAAKTVVALNAILPSTCNNQPLVYLRWVYFSIPVTGAKGTRPTIMVDDIQVGSNVFPVLLQSFGVENANGAAALTWKTTNEINFSRFEVEKATGNGQFSTLTSVVAKGGNNNTYSLTDKQAFAGTSQYRLKMINTDGSFSYSSVITFTAGAKANLSIAPNPVTGSSFALTHPAAGKGAVAFIYSFNGSKVASYPVKENNTVTTISAVSLSKGNYVLVYLDGAKKLSLTFTKN